MDATPALTEIGRALKKFDLKVVLIGNAAAALQGAPVTTVDFDFMFRKTPRNLSKLKRFTIALGATLLRPYYPVSDLYRVMRDDGLQVDFMATIHGVRSFEGLLARATDVTIGSAVMHVASLADIIRSKKAAKRPRDLAVLQILENTLEERTRQQAAETRRAPQRE